MEYMLSTRGMPMRMPARFFNSSARFFWDAVIWNLGAGPATFGASGTRNTALAAISTKFGLAFLILSRLPLIWRMSSTFSTVPFSQVAIIRRWDPASSGTLVLTGGLKSILMTLVLTSMNVRRHLFLQK